MYQFLPHLEKMGVSVRVQSIFDREDYETLNAPEGTIRKAGLLARGLVKRTAQAFRLGDYDLVHLYRQPIFPVPGALEKMMASRRIPYVFDFDDAIFLEAPNPLSPFSSVIRSPKRVPKAIAAAALVTAGNYYLAEYARDYSDCVEILPTCVELDRFTVRKPLARSSIVVGWMGSRSTVPYLSVLDEPLRNLAARMPETTLRVVGGDHRIEGVRVESSPWSLAGEVNDLHGFDIGVMPLPDDPWTRGKSGLKILQYMACGVPVVASPVGVNKEIIEDGHNGFLASNESEWYEKLFLLMSDRELWLRFAVEGRRTVEQGYALSVWAEKLKGMFDRVVETHGGGRS